MIYFIEGGWFFHTKIDFQYQQSAGTKHENEGNFTENVTPCKNNFSRCLFCSTLFNVLIATYHAI
jgi:hypothetical protein